MSHSEKIAGTKVLARNNLVAEKSCCAGSRRISPDIRTTQRWFYLVFLLVCWIATNAFAHTLPISYLTVVSDKDYLHVELVMNPFELNFNPDFESNKNHALDSAAAKVSENTLSQRILRHLKIKADGKLLSAETSGISVEPGSDHLVLRAHYRIADLQPTLSVESDLTAITSASHLTEVTFVKGDERQLARLDSQEHLATFAQKKNSSETVTPIVPIPEGPATSGFLIIIPLTILPALIGLFLLLKFTRNLRHRTSPPP